MGVFVIPKSNTLRFVRTDNYKQSGQTHDNRLLLDEVWQIPEEIIEYAQKFVPGDPILIQLITNYDPNNIAFTLRNQSGTVDANGSFTRQLMYSFSDGSGNKIYNYTLDQSVVSFSGLKYVTLTAADPAMVSLEFQSETFEFGSFSHLPYIKWQGSDRSGIYWDSQGLTKFGFRAEVAQKYSASSETSMYEGFNFTPQTLFAIPRFGVELASDPIPRYIAEKLELAFKHDYTWVNDVPFSANGESAKIQKMDRVNMYEFGINVIQVDYEDYAAIAEVSGQIVQNKNFLDYDNSYFVDWDGSRFIGQQ